MELFLGAFAGLTAWILVRFVLMNIYTVDQNERAVKTIFGRAERVPGEGMTESDPVSEFLRPEERSRYNYPKVRVIPPGGPYFKMPWERIYKVSVATMTVNMAMDMEDPGANEGGSKLEAVTRDQLNTGGNEGAFGFDYILFLVNSKGDKEKTRLIVMGLFLVNNGDLPLGLI